MANEGHEGPFHAPTRLSVEGVRELLEIIGEDYRMNGREISRPAFRALAVQRFGAWRLAIPQRLVRAPMSILYRAAHRFVRNVYGIEIHDTTIVGRRVRILHQAGITISSAAVIGDDCVIRHGVSIGRGGLDTEPAPVLGRGVVVGVGAAVLGGVHVGDGATIAPMAVVMKDVPAGAIAAPPPTRVLGAPPAAGDRSA